MKGLEKILGEIDREEKNALLSIEHTTGYKAGALNMANTIKDIIRKHMAGAPDGWIPVDERLPEEEQEVWVSAKTDCVRRGTYTKHFGAEHKEGFICSDGFMWMNTANAWKPYVVPEPYRPERSV